MEDSEIMEWQPVRIAPPDGKAHFKGEVEGQAPERRMKFNWKMAECRPCKNDGSCICGGRTFEIRHDDFIPIIGSNIAMTCEHQILAD